MAKLRPLSNEMAACLYAAEEHGGKLIRHTGGLWSWPGCLKRSDGVPETSFGATTIMALVARDEMAFVEWRDRPERSRYRQPVAVRLTGPAETMFPKSMATIGRALDEVEEIIGGGNV